MTQYDSFCKIIQLWGKPSVLAGEINAIIESNDFRKKFPHMRVKNVLDRKVRMWKFRNSIPANYWLPITMAATKIGEREITLKLLREIEPGYKRKAKEKEKKNGGNA